MANHLILKPFILKWEGGFANDPRDRGGATNRGITIATFKSYRKRTGGKTPSVDDLKRITDDEWTDIYKSMFWDLWRADEIQSQRVANALVDWVWGSGNYGIKIPQRLLKVKQDGIVGAKTLAALNAAGDAFFDTLMTAREKYLYDICNKRPSQRVFLRGWLNRLNDLRAQTWE